MKGFIEFVNEAKQFSLPQSITADYKVRHYQKKETLYHEGDIPNLVYFINKGKIKTWKMSAEGKEFITGIHDKGEFFGYISMLEGTEHSDSATTLEEVEVALIPQSDFLSLIYSNKDISACFVKMLANDISEKEERLLGLAYNSVRARVAGTLLNLQKKYPQNSSIRISRDDLAGIVGTSTESLIRTLSDFKEEKMIEADGREIKVVNITGLEKIKKFS
jgi:CRP-like cAMP-binding protein